MKQILLLGLILAFGSVYSQTNTASFSSGNKSNLQFGEQFLKNGMLKQTQGLKTRYSLAISNRRKEQRNTDISVAGIGFELGKPKIGSGLLQPTYWKGVNVLYSFLEFGVSHGEMRFESTWAGFDNSQTLYGRRYYVGFNIPISVLGVGTYKSYKKVLRAHPILQVAFGSYAVWKAANKTDKTSSPFMSISPGMRLRLPYCSFDVRLNSSLHALSRGPYEGYFNTLTFYPSFVLRFDGLYEFFNPGSVTVNATSYTITGASSKTETSTSYRGDTKVTTQTTTNTMSVSTQAKTVMLDDIGTYLGIGPRYTFSLPHIREYSNTGGMFGIGAHVRKAVFLAGLNIEGGRIGHASTFKRNADKPKFRGIDKTQDFGTGSLQTFNMFFDLGLDVTSTAIGFLGTVIEENSATGFFSLNVGYSMGFSIVSGQRFDNDSTALAHYTTIPERTKLTDPRENKSGYLGGFFLGMDVGAVNFRIQAYRFRNAPLASQAFYSVTYRLPLFRDND